MCVCECVKEAEAIKFLFLFIKLQFNAHKVIKTKCPFFVLGLVNIKISYWSVSFASFSDFSTIHINMLKEREREGE